MEKLDNQLLNDMPYKGLEPYSESEQDALSFFGRQEQQKIIKMNLKNSPLTLLFGESGVGKSSVLRAGVVHSLREEMKRNLAEYGTPRFAVAMFPPLEGDLTWQDDPLIGILKQVEADIHNSGLDVQTPAAGLTFAETLLVWTRRIGGKGRVGELFIILDQFEEYFLYHPEEDGESTFAVEFPRAVNRPNLRVNFLISIRSDSLAQLDRFKGRIPGLFDNLLRVEHLDEKSAYKAIEKPVTEYYNKLVPPELSVEVEPKLIEEVLKQIAQSQHDLGSGNGKGGLDKLNNKSHSRIEAPYLQLVMTRLWREEMKRGSRSLRLKTLNELGSIKQIFNEHVYKVMKELSDSERDIAASIFQYLVTPAGTKITYPVLELAKPTGDDAKQIATLLEKLAYKEQRIVRPVGALPSQPPENKRYEIFHDFLAQPILNWRRIYLNKKEWEQTRQRLERQLKETRDRRNLAIMQGLPAQALRQQRRRQNELAALLARQAYIFCQHNPRCQVSDQVDEALREILSASYFSNILQYSNPIYSVALSLDGKILAAGDFQGIIHLWNLEDKSLTKKLEGHKGMVNSITFSPDSQTLASGGNDKTIRLWDLRQQQIMPTVLEGHKQQVTSVAFSPDGQMLASGSHDKTIRLWHLFQSDTEPIVLTGHKNIVRAITFSPDGQTLASASDDRTIILWNLGKPTSEPTVRYGHEKIVRTVAFSPDGKILASGSDDWTIRLWDLSQSKTTAPKVLEGHKERIRTVAFSPDAKILASGSDDQTVRLWNLQQPDREPKVLKGHYFDIHSLAFSPDGQMLVSGSKDYTVRLWDLRPPIAAPPVLKDHAENILAVAFSPNGQMLASGSLDKTVRLWNLEQPNEPPKEVFKGHKAEVRSVAFSPNGQILAWGSADKTVRLWNLEQPNEPLKILSGHEDGVSAVAFSPDGQRLASGSWKEDKTIRLWDLKQLDREPIVLTGHEDSITSVAFSPDGKMLASGSDDKTIKLWKLEQPDSDPIVLEDHQGRVWSVAFSPPDGKMLASGSDDKTIRLWKLEQLDAERKFFKILRGHNTWVDSLAFSPDGKMLASGSYDRSIRLWNLSQLDEEPIVLQGHEQSVTSVAFSPDGKTVASGSYDNTIRLWNTSTKELADMVCQKVWRNLTMEEWQKFMGDDIPYEQTCPNLPPIAQLYPRQKKILKFIEQRATQQLDTSEEDVTNFLNEPKGDEGIYYRLENLRLLGFLEITDRGHGRETIRYALSPRYREYLSQTKARQTE